MRSIAKLSPLPRPACEALGLTVRVGKQRVNVPHVSVQSREDKERIKEDAIAILLRPATFGNHSGRF